MAILEFEDWLGIILVILLVSLFFNSSLTNNLNFGITKGIFINYTNITNLPDKVNGVNYGDFFVIMTKGYTPNQIAEVTFHELAHYYAYQDYGHFCNGGNQTLFDNTVSK